jgi:uncharacterized membrane protein YfcA
MIGDPIFWAAAVPAVLLAGISKASGNGLGMVAVPLLALAVAPPVAAGIMLPILCAMDLLGLWAWRGRADRAVLATILPGAMLGIAIGTAAFGLLDVRWIKGLLGVEAVAFALHRIVARHSIASRPPEPASHWRGGFWGAVSGFTSTLAHAGNPPLMQYLLPLRLDKERFVGTTVVFFTAVNAAKLLPYAWLGLFESTNLLASALLLPIVPLGYWAGIRLVKRLPEPVFYRVLVGSLLLIGVRLLHDAFSA